jgi:hypothetical protein
LPSCLAILSLGLKIEHSYWNCTGCVITLKQPMSEMLGKITFSWWLGIWKMFGVQQESKTKTSLTDKKSILMAFLTLVALKL